MTGGSKEKAEPGVLLVGVDVEQELKKDRPTERVTPARILGRSFIINLVLKNGRHLRGPYLLKQT